VEKDKHTINLKEERVDILKKARKTGKKQKYFTPNTTRNIRMIFVKNL